MRIAPPDDDVRITKLNRPKETQGTETVPIKQTDPTEPTPPIKEQREHNSRSPEDRRKNQRRKTQRQTLLDTRNKHERRHDSRRDDDIEQLTEEEATPFHGIDVEA